MSRRSRQRGSAGKAGWAGKAALGLLGIGIAGVGIGYGVLRNYLHSEGFRKFLSAEVSDAAAVAGVFSPFRWEGLAVETDAFEATGEGLVTGVRADGLHTEIGLGGVRRGVWEIRGSQVNRLDVSLDLRKSEGLAALSEAKEKRPAREKTGRAGWIPSEIELQQFEVREMAVKAILNEGLATATGLNVKLEQAGARDAYRAEIRGGRVRLPHPWLPELRVENAKLRYQNGQVFLADSSVGAWTDGRVTASGEWDLESRRLTFEGEAKGLKCEDLLDGDWSKRLTGDVSSNFTLQGKPGAPTAGGALAVDHGVITALPMLDALAAYADTRRFRVLSLDEARTDWRWTPDGLAFSKLVLSTNGLVRLEGAMTVRGRELDGLFRLGLAPGTLSSIPGAETDVFLPGERGLLWTPLRITGTLDDPKEDLTGRLIAAAGLRMFDQLPESGEKALKFTRSLLEEQSPDAIGKGVKILEEGSKTAREVGDILESLLDSPGKEK